MKGAEQAEGWRGVGSEGGIYDGEQPWRWGWGRGGDGRGIAADGTDSVVMIGDGRCRRVVMLNIEGEVEGEATEGSSRLGRQKGAHRSP